MHAALHLFNQSGFVNVRLQHISDDTVISLGNIAYHFPNKEAIVSALYQRWEKKIKEVLIEYRNTPIFAHVDRIFSSMDTLQNEFSFFFTDLIEIKRSYPSLFQKIEEFLQWQVFLFQEIIRFNVARGAMTAVNDLDIAFIAEWVIFQIHSFPSQRTMGLNIKGSQLASSPLASHMWSLLLPYLTHTGEQELHTHLSQTIAITPNSPQP